MKEYKNCIYSDDFKFCLGIKEELKYALDKIELHPDTKIIKELAFFDSNITEAVLNEGLKTIQTEAFSNSLYLKKINFPDSLELIGPGAFESCVNLKEAILENTQIGEIKNYSFAYCQKLEKVTLPKEMSSIGSNSFAGTGFKKIDLPDTIIEISSSAFARNTNLEEFKFPKMVENVRIQIFEECKNLKKVDLSNIKEIEIGAFKNCGNLNTIILPKTLQTFSTSAFTGTKVASLFLPAGIENIFLTMKNKLKR